MTAGDHREAGFTLIELLIGLSLVALLSLAVFSGIGLSSRMWRLSETWSRSANDRLLLSHALAQRWQRLEPVRVRTSNGGTAIFFEGTAKQMRYLTSAPVGLDGGMFAEEIFLRRNDQGSQLILRRARAPILSTSATWDESVVELPGRAYEFRYIGGDGETSDWANSQALPAALALVEIRGELEATLVMASPRIYASRLFLTPDQAAAAFDGGAP